MRRVADRPIRMSGDGHYDWNRNDRDSMDHDPDAPSRLATVGQLHQVRLRVNQNAICPCGRCPGWMARWAPHCGRGHRYAVNFCVTPIRSGLRQEAMNRPYAAPPPPVKPRLRLPQSLDDCHTPPIAPSITTLLWIRSANTASADASGRQNPAGKDGSRPVPRASSRQENWPVLLLALLQQAATGAKCRIFRHLDSGRVYPELSRAAKRRRLE